MQAGGILNTATTLELTTAAGSYPLAMGQLATNTAPYVALVLATSGLSWFRRIKALAGGVSALVVSHIVYIVLAFQFAPAIRNAPDLPTVIAQLFLTLPFFLWIVLVYRNRWAGRVDQQSVDSRTDGGDVAQSASSTEVIRQ